MKNKIKSDLLLILTALIWGSSFVAQRAGMEYIEPFTFNGIRNYIGFLVLIPVILVFSKKETKKSCAASVATEKKNLIIGGLCCGIVLFIASSLQQFGMVYTSAGKAGFITALYIVLVPILGVFIGKKVRPILWLCVLIAVIGLYLLTIKDGFSISKGDFLVLLCAFFFAVHILVIDHFSPKVDGIKMSCLQFLVCGIISTPLLFIFESPDWTAIINCWVPILYAGVLSSGVAFTLQIVAQRNADPTVTSLLLSLESVFAVLSGMLILQERLSPKEILGCIIMFTAVIIAQLPAKKEQLPIRKEN